MENDYNLYLKIKERNVYFKKYKNQTEMDLFEKEVCIAFRKIYYQEFKEYYMKLTKVSFLYLFTQIKNYNKRRL